ncbi:hypothetical protein E2C01_080656 [Portunus trituberculatus]|uniref:Uncharacterized protein n=1 Tax=Portunus trituberculatus TaxID=210409 RepID=A0A5B7IYY3_PORTR|nr:hypothetical protein [Portunus trituberculatus]
MQEDRVSVILIIVIVVVVVVTIYWSIDEGLSTTFSLNFRRLCKGRKEKGKKRKDARGHDGCLEFGRLRDRTSAHWHTGAARVSHRV